MAGWLGKGFATQLDSLKNQVGLPFCVHFLLLFAHLVEIPGVNVFDLLYPVLSIRILPLNTYSLGKKHIFPQKKKYIGNILTV